MAKHLALIVAMLFIPALARADNMVFVNMAPVSLGGVGWESPGVTFVWDTSNQTLSDITLTVTSPFWQKPFTEFTAGPVPSGSSSQYNGVPGGPYLSFHNFTDSEGDIFQLNYGIHGDIIPSQFVLQSTPGTYITDTWFWCPLCLPLGPGGRPALQGFVEGTATVSPVATPEPNTLILLGAGITALALVMSLRNGATLTLSRSLGPCVTL